MDFSTTLQRQQAQARLDAKVATRTPGHLFTLQELNHSEVLVERKGDEFSVRRQRSYVNLWESIFVGRLVEAENKGVKVIGTFEKNAWLHKAFLFWHAAGVIGIVGMAYLAYLRFGYSPSHQKWALFIGSELGIALVTAGLYITIFICKKHYSQLATGDKESIMGFLTGQLALRPAPQVILSEEEDEHDQVAA